MKKELLTLFITLLLIQVLLVLTACQAESVDDKEPIQQTVITVENIEQFINAIAPDTHIIMNAGYYDIEAFVDFKGYDNLAYQEVSDNEYVGWEQLSVWDGYQLNITNVSNLTIEGSTLGVSEIVTPYHRRVIQFDGCSDITIKNIKTGHCGSIESDGEVFGFKDCEEVSIENVLMYGCVQGLFIMSSENFSIRESSVYECIGGIFSTESSNRINFVNCNFFDNKGYDQVRLSSSSDITIDRCSFTGNKALSSEWSSFFHLYTSSGIVVKNSILKDNASRRSFVISFRKDDGTVIEDNVENSIVFENNIMENNNWNAPDPNGIDTANPLEQETILIVGQMISTDAKCLDLNNTEITDLTPLQHLKQLTWLEIEYTGISDLTPLQSLVNLEELSIENTQVSDLTPLLSLSNLKKLLAQNCSELSFEQFEALENALPNCQIFY